MNLVRKTNKRNSKKPNGQYSKIFNTQHSNKREQNER